MSLPNLVRFNQSTKGGTSYLSIRNNWVMHCQTALQFNRGSYIMSFVSKTESVLNVLKYDEIDEIRYVWEQISAVTSNWGTVIVISSVEFHCSSAKNI